MPEKQRVHCLIAAGGTAGAVLNAANEAAVAAFLDGEIPYTAIVPACRSVLEAHSFDAAPTLDDLIRLDRWARNTQTVLDDLVVSLVRWAFFPLMAVGAIALSLKGLTLPKNIFSLVGLLWTAILTIFGVRAILTLLLHILQDRWAANREDRALALKAVVPVLKIALWSVGLIFFLDNAGVKATAGPIDHSYPPSVMLLALAILAVAGECMLNHRRSKSLFGGRKPTGIALAPKLEFPKGRAGP